MKFKAMIWKLKANVYDNMIYYTQTYYVFYGFNAYASMLINVVMDVKI